MNEKGKGKGRKGKSYRNATGILDEYCGHTMDTPWEHTGNTLRIMLEILRTLYGRTMGIL